MTELYSVVSQRHVSRLNAAGTAAEDGIEVRFTYGQPPQEGVIFVPGELPDPEQARAKILDYVQRASAIQDLTG